MGNFFFSGSVEAKLDDKNRFVLPQSMRFGLVEEGELEFTLALGLGGCLVIYRKSTVDKIVARFKEKQHVGKFQKFFTLFFSTLHRTTCDKIGRVVLPSVLKNAVNIDVEIVIAGVLDKIEIWPKDKYEAQLEGLVKGTDKEMMDLCAEAFGLLEEEERNDG